MNKKIEAIGSGIRPPLEAKMQYLHLEDLHWEQFENLCLAIVSDKFTIDHCERYGRGGQKQEGIDIFAINNIDDTLSFFQCKKYDKLTVSDLNDIIATFKKGKFYSKSKEFYICSACHLDDVKIQDKFNFHKNELEKDGISLYKWDLIQISRTLKTKPQIVYDHFGPAIFKAFIGEEHLSSISPLSKEEIKKQLKIASSELSFIDNNFYLPDTHIERKETNDLYQWIITDSKSSEKEKDERHNISILTGNAGIGKTVILKDLLDILNQNNIPVLGLKADKKRLGIEKPLESVLENINIINLFDHLTTQHPTIVLLVDQIDALSQSLSTNREQIRAYISLINKLSLNQSVKIIISCRTFDLNYDAEFKQYRKNKIFHVGLLDELDIEKVLKKVTKRNLTYFPLSLIELLKTPLHLEVFCRIYNESIVQEIKSLQDLYRELWNQKVKKANSVSHLDFRRVESLLFDIASKIYDRQDNLCAPSMLFDEYYEEVQYLKSVHLIVEDKGNIQFFHQSFYDYTFARDFVEKQNGELYSFIQNLSHQGLFIRSMIKQILTYLRIYDPQGYIKELESILFSSDIRYHIKHLIVNHLSFEEKPIYKEKQIVLKLIEKIPTLAAIFFLANSRTLNKGWHNLLLDEKKLLIRLLNNVTGELAEAVKRFVVFSVDLNVEDTLNLLLNIEDEIERYSTIDWTLIRLNDFRAPLTNELFDELNDKYLKSDQQRFHILDQAIISNPEFAISRAKNIFGLNLCIKRENFTLSLYSDEFRHFCDFCENLHKFHPNKAYSFTKDIINILISSTIREHYIEKDYYLDEDYAFENYEPGHTNEYHQLLKWNIDYLTSQTTTNLKFVKREVENLLSSKMATNFLIAYHVLSESPQLFLSEIFVLLTDEQICTSSLDIDDLSYHYREIWRKSYPLFDLETQNRFNHFILSFHPKSTLRKDKSFLEMRKKYGTYQKDTKQYPYPFWGRDQQLLLHSIPNEYIDLNKNLRRRKGELDRRFSGNGWSCENKKPYHGVTAASFCGGFTSEAKYKKLTISQWNNSFLVYNNHEDSDKRRYFDLDAHANHFKDAVKENVNHFSTFVTDLIEQNKVNIKYQINGLEGLMLGGYHKYEILILYKKLINCNMEEREQYSFLRLSNYFIEENIIDDAIVEYWKDYLVVPLAERSGYWDNTDKKHPFFSKGHTSINAISINLLIKSLSIVKYSNSIYNYLLEISSQLPIELKLVILYEFNNQEKSLSDEELLKIFLSYSKEVDSEIFLVSPNLINYLFYRCFDQLMPFIEKTIYLQNAENFYGIYLLYAWFYGNEIAKDLLFQVHQKYPASIKATIGQACRYLENDEYQQKSLHILDIYSSDTRKDIREAYQQSFYKLNPKDFEIVSPIIKKFINDNDEERQLYNLYRYLTDCATTHCIECIEILRLIDYDKLSKGRKEIEEPIKLLTICYNTVKKYDNPDINLEYVMDVFDRILHFTSYDTNIDKMLRKLDSE